MKISNESIKNLETTIFKFVWNGAIETIKRGTLILPYERGGLNMINIRAKIETIMFQQFLGAVSNRYSSFYQLSVYWMKFTMREFDLRNFNTIPIGNECQRPEYYVEMIRCVNRMKEFDRAYHQKFETLTSKATYKIMVEKYFIKPKIEASVKLDDIHIIEWKSIYSRISSIENSDVRVLNYKILYDALPCNQRFVRNDRRARCTLCDKQTETLEHLYIRCNSTKELFRIIAGTLDNEEIVLNKNSILFGLNLTERDFKTISFFKYLVWEVRKKLRKSRVDTYLTVFNRLYYAFKKIFS